MWVGTLELFFLIDVCVAFLYLFRSYLSSSLVLGGLTIALILLCPWNITNWMIHFLGCNREKNAPEIIPRIPTLLSWELFKKKFLSLSAVCAWTYREQIFRELFLPPEVYITPGLVLTGEHPGTNNPLSRFSTFLFWKVNFEFSRPFCWGIDISLESKVKNYTHCRHEYVPI